MLTELEIKSSNPLRLWYQSFRIAIVKGDSTATFSNAKVGAALI